MEMCFKARKKSQKQELPIELVEDVRKKHCSVRPDLLWSIWALVMNQGQTGSI